jgi:hypothetical protein
MEYFWLYKHLIPAASRRCFEEFKYGQDVSSKIWIAATSALGLLYFWKDLKGGDAPLNLKRSPKQTRYPRSLRSTASAL